MESLPDLPSPASTAPPATPEVKLQRGSSSNLGSFSHQNSSESLGSTPLLGSPAATPESVLAGLSQAEVTRCLELELERQAGLETLEAPEFRSQASLLTNAASFAEPTTGPVAVYRVRGWSTHVHILY